MARVIVGGTDYGPHPFFFQVRDWETHESLPGIELRDIGQKLGYNGMDNGAMRISNVKIPRRNLLMRFVVVDKDGTYRKVGDDKMLFGTMTYTRLKISSMSGFNLAKACTTAVRYSAVRRQFQMQRVVLGADIEKADENNDLMSASTPQSPQDQLSNLVKPSKRSESQVLDYSSQQYILFPQLALAFAMHFAGMAAGKRYDKAIVEFRAGKFDALTEMHVLTSTLKAVSTVLMADGMEQCRKSLGGHGFLNAAGVGPQYLSALPQATYEGDFVVLSIQVGQQLLNAVSSKMLKGITSNPKTPSLQYIYDYDPLKPQEPLPSGSVEAALKDHDFLVSSLKLRANFLHYAAAQTFQEEIAAQGQVGPSTLDAVKIELMRMTYAHAYVLYAEFFRARLLEIQDDFPKVAAVLSLVFELYCLSVMDTGYDKGSGFGDFVACAALPPAAYGFILKREKQLLKELRPHAVPLVDGWNIPDFLLNSCLGRYDGRVYESLYEATLYEPLNESDVSDGYYKHLQYLLHPGRRHAPQPSKL